MTPDLALEIRAYRSPEYPRTPVAIYITAGRGGKYQSVRFAEPEPLADGAQHPCAARLSLEEAQLLMDSLWEAGLRPAAGAGSVGQLSAVERHLEDMRVVAFAKIGVKKP